MFVFFVSVRTARIYGPGEILEVYSTQNEAQLYLRMSWQYPYQFDEWEGYAVVVPERNKVWGLSHPKVEDQELVMEFPFTPQDIPPKDRQLFVPLMKALKVEQAGSETTIED